MLSALLVCLIASVIAPQGKNSAPAPTVVIAGRVIDLRGEGVPAASVRVEERNRPDVVLARTVADGEGYFRMGRVPQRPWLRIGATAEGRCLAYWYSRGANESVVIELQDAATLHGVLHNRKGEPVAHVVVRAAHVGRVLFSVECLATTDDDGRFELAGVPLGATDVAAWIEGQGLFEARVHVIADAAVELKPCDDAPTSLQVTITGLPKEGAPAVSLAMLPYHDGRLSQLPPPLKTPQFAGSTWQVALLPDWEYRLRPRADGFVFAPNEFIAKKGQGPHAATFAATTVDSAPLRWSAVVHGAGGDPVAGLRFVMRRISGGDQTEATSDEHGVMTFASLLAPGTNVIVYTTDDLWTVDQDKSGDMQGVHDRRFLNEHECKVDPEHTLELRVTKACSVTGRLLREDGRPAPLVEVQLEERHDGRGPEWMTFAYARTDREGRFRFGRLHHFADSVRVHADGNAGSITGEPFTIQVAGTEAEVPELRLAAPSVIEGVVRDEQQQPAAGFAVWLRDWDLAKRQQRSGSVTEVVTDRQGRYRFVGVPTGGAYLQIVADEDRFGPTAKAVDPFEVEAGKTYEFDLVVKH